MAEIVKNLKKGFVQGTGIVMAMFMGGALYVFATSLNATDGETLTATKWNALVDKVNNSSADRVCPSGFVSVGSGYQLGCIQTALNPAKLWIDAAKDCYEKYGAKLPSGNERFIAVQYNGIGIPSGGLEWVDVLFYSNNGTNTFRSGVLYNIGTNYVGTAGTETQTYSYRCFIPR